MEDSQFQDAVNRINAELDGRHSKAFIWMGWEFYQLFCTAFELSGEGLGQSKYIFPETVRTYSRNEGHRFAVSQKLKPDEFKIEGL
jgi:hypothetical protein